MLKKQKILLILLILIILLAGAFTVHKINQNKKDKEFLSKLTGEVVFTRRDKSGVSNIWKINANGTGEVMLFHNDKYGGPAKNFNSGSPQWSKDGTKIYFRSMDKDNKSKIFEMDFDDKNVKALEKNPTDYKLDDIRHFSREKDIIVREGDIYYINKNNQEIKIYNFKGPYSQDFNPGVTEASWSPDKKYIIFNGPRGLMIVDLQGNTAKLTSGINGNWKY